MPRKSWAEIIRYMPGSNGEGLRRAEMDADCEWRHGKRARVVHRRDPDWGYLCWAVEVRE